jgi:hypothetical protein
VREARRPHSDQDGAAMRSVCVCVQNLCLAVSPSTNNCVPSALHLQALTPSAWAPTPSASSGERASAALRLQSRACCAAFAAYAVLLACSCCSCACGSPSTGADSRTPPQQGSCAFTALQRRCSPAQALQPPTFQHPDVRTRHPTRNRYAEAEKTNGRWAMMAVAGIIGQELLGVQPAWWEAGAKDYGVPMAPLTAIEFLVSASEGEWRQAALWGADGGSLHHLAAVLLQPPARRALQHSHLCVRGGQQRRHNTRHPSATGAGPVAVTRQLWPRAADAAGRPQQWTAAVGAMRKSLPRIPLHHAPARPQFTYSSALVLNLSHSPPHSSDHGLP